MLLFLFKLVLFSHLWCIMLLFRCFQHEHHFLRLRVQFQPSVALVWFITTSSISINISIIATSFINFCVIHCHLLHQRQHHCQLLHLHQLCFITISCFGAIHHQRSISTEISSNSIAPPNMITPPRLQFQLSSLFCCDSSSARPNPAAPLNLITPIQHRLIRSVVYHYRFAVIFIFDVSVLSVLAESVSGIMRLCFWNSICYWNFVSWCDNVELLQEVKFWTMMLMRICYI